MKEKFCNDCNLTSFVPQLVAEELLGKEQLPLIETRYRVMRENCDGKTASESEYNMIDVIRCTHPTFKSDFEKIGKGAIGLDLPTWFNIGSNKRVMLISQDPLRGSEYSECRDVTVSSPFGLHDAKYRRGKSNSARIMYALVQKLVAGGYGVYLTDVRKFFVYESETTNKHAEERFDSYKEILKEEIKAVEPSLCVCLGNVAEETFSHMNFGVHFVKLPHPNAHARTKEQKFPELKSVCATDENVAEQYANKIIGEITK